MPEFDEDIVEKSNIHLPQSGITDLLSVLRVILDKKKIGFLSVFRRDQLPNVIRAVSIGKLDLTMKSTEVVDCFAEHFLILSTSVKGYRSEQIKEISGSYYRDVDPEDTKSKGRSNKEVEGVTK